MSKGIAHITTQPSQTEERLFTVWDIVTALLERDPAAADRLSQTLLAVAQAGDADPLTFCRWLHQQIAEPTHWQDWPDPQLGTVTRERRLDAQAVLQRLERVLAAAKTQEQRP